MNPANSSSASSSATMSPNAPVTPTTDSHAGAAPSKISEADFLQQQAKAAGEALSSAFAELTKDLGKGADPRAWVKSHPWITLASASVAGFATAAAVIPSKEQQAVARLRAIELALHPREAPHNGQTRDQAPPPKQKEGGGLLGVLLHELFAALKPAIITLLSAHLSPQAPAPAPADEPAAEAPAPQ